MVLNDDDDSGDAGVVTGPDRPAPVTIQPPSDDDDDDADAAGDHPPDGGDPAAAAAIKAAKGEGDRGGERRSNKNQSRWLGNQAMQAELTRVNQTVARLQREHTESLQRMRDEIMGAVQQRSKQQDTGGQAASPLEAQIAEVHAGLAAEIKLMKQHDPEKGDYDLTRYNNLRRQEQKLSLRQDLAEIGITPEQLAALKNGGGAPRELLGAETQIAVRFQTLSQEFPWVAGSAAAAQALGHYRRYLLSAGRPDNLETDREAAMYIQRSHGLAPQRAPGGNPAAARRGLPAGPGEGRPRNGARAPITIDPSLLDGSGLSMKQIAHAVYSDD